MRVTTRLVLDIATGSVLESEGFDYTGPVALCKGDDTAKQSEELSLQNQQQQMNIQQQMLSIFQQQFGNQQQVLQYLKVQVQPIIDAGGKGYSDQALAAMRTSANDQLSGQYQHAQQALQAGQFANGGRDLPSGVDQQLNASLLQSEAADKAGAQNSITLQNENLKQANYWNAINELNGVGAQFNPQSYGSMANEFGNSAISAGNSVANLSNAYQNSVNSSFLGTLGRSFGGALGSGLGGGFAGGMGTGVSTLGSGNWGW